MDRLDLGWRTREGQSIRSAVSSPSLARKNDAKDGGENSMNQFPTDSKYLLEYNNAVDRKENRKLGMRVVQRGGVKVGVRFQ